MIGRCPQSFARWNPRSDISEAWRVRNSNLLAGDSIACDATSTLQPTLTHRSEPERSGTCRTPTCPIGQGTGLHSLTLVVPKTGLTSHSTEFSMCKVANRGPRFRFGSSSGTSGLQGSLPANANLLD